MSTRFCFVRHGETAWNALRRIQGHLDLPLNANGIAQARALANSLLGETFGALYSSDLERARHTAEAVAHVLHLPVRVLPALRERNFGVFQGLTFEECTRRYPAEHARLRARDPDFAIPGGESLGQFSRRVLDSVAELALRHPGAQVLVATHGGVLDMLYRRATGRGLEAPRECEIPNAALNWIEVDAEDWSLLAWADRSHLVAALDELSG
jgi:probable phosphoglycerate mutase